MSNQPIDDGGPAFPGEQGMMPDGLWNQTWEPGMSLRDWFAGQALQGRAHRFDNPHEHRELLAKDCYEMADAMLAARKGERPQ
jgi:hypothetical protein